MHDLILNLLYIQLVAIYLTVTKILFNYLYIIITIVEIVLPNIQIKIHIKSQISEL